MRETDMERDFDYSQKILVAVETGTSPHVVPGLPPSHGEFKRVGIPEVVQAFARKVNPLARLLIGSKFRRVLDQRMGYWEKRVPAGQACFVHYVRGPETEINAAFDRFKAASQDWLTLGVYHVEPQSSSYPFAFPFGSAPDHWFLGETRDFTPDSLFWFNFFPAQKFLFEKTFVIWALFNLFRSREGGACNQLVALESPERLIPKGVDRFVQVNLNRFTNFAGYFSSAREAGKHTFTNDKEYLWYGMLLRRHAS
jgi:hypothetical protein